MFDFFWKLIIIKPIVWFSQLCHYWEITKNNKGKPHQRHFKAFCIEAVRCLVPNAWLPSESAIYPHQHFELEKHLQKSDWREVEVLIFFLIFRNMENMLQKKDLFLHSVFGLPHWSCTLTNGNVTLFTSMEQIQPPSLPGLHSGQEVAYFQDQILISWLNCMRSWSSKSIALIQSTLKERPWPAGAWAGQMTVVKIVSGLWSPMMPLWHTPVLPSQVELGAQLCLPQNVEYDFIASSWKMWKHP
jgi:hypothetical protein